MFMAACGLITPTNLPPWPDSQALRALDLRPLRSNDAVKVSELLSFAIGVWNVCGDVPEMRSRDSEELARRSSELGMALVVVLKAEVERLHPGHPENRTAINHLMALMTERGLVSGQDAAMVRGCDAMRPVEAEGFRAFWSWQPPAPPDSNRR
jgi:hypothetical protein